MTNVKQASGHLFKKYSRHLELLSMLLIGPLLLTPLSAEAQVITPFTRTPDQVYKIKGDYTIIGNSNMKPTSPSANNNNNTAMEYIDIDNDNTTVNSTSATLELKDEHGQNQGSSTVLYAGLYWTGRNNKGGSLGNLSVNNQNNGTTILKPKVVKFKKEGDIYQTITANTGDIYYPTNGASSNIFAGYADVTAYVQLNGPGKYYVADIAGQEGDGGDVGYFGGWALVVVYSNPHMTSRYVTLFQGYAFIDKNSNPYYDFEIEGLQAVPNGQVDASLGFLAAEGDKTLTGDYLSVYNNSTNQYDKLENHQENDTKTNYFSSRISTGGQPRNPSNTNNFGVDVVKTPLTNTNNQYIDNGATSIKFRYGTNSDVYSLPFFAFSVVTYTNTISIVNDANALTDNKVNKTGNEPLPTLYANILDGSGKVSQSLLVQDVNNNGEVTINSGSGTISYTIQLSATQGTVGNPPPTDAPTGWVFTGETKDGITPDGTADGKLHFDINNGDVTGVIFGLNKIPEPNTLYPSTSPKDLDQQQSYDGNDWWRLPPDAFGGNDQDGNVKSFIFTGLPQNVDIIEINNIQYTSNNFPATGIIVPANPNTGEPAQTIRVHNAISHGTETIHVPFKVVDNGDAVSSETNAYFTFPQPLPVKMISFQADKNDLYNDLYWKTAKEVGNKGFYVQRSNDAKSFNTIGFVPAKDGQAELKYKFSDKSPLPISYYRLEQVDLDGKKSYSKIVFVDREGSVKGIEVYPNPADDVLNIRQTVDFHNTATLINAVGREVRTFHLNKRYDQIQLDNLPTGVYILKIGKANIKIQIK